MKCVFTRAEAETLIQAGADFTSNPPCTEYELLTMPSSPVPLHLAFKALAAGYQIVSATDPVYDNLVHVKGDSWATVSGGPYNWFKVYADQRWFIFPQNITRRRFNIAILRWRLKELEQEESEDK